MQKIGKWLLACLFVTTLGCNAEQSDSSAPGAPSGPETSAAQVKPAPVSVDYQEGVHYEVLPQPVPTATGDKIEVTEVFWYGCSHCFDFEPTLEKWAEQLPDDVVLIRNPAQWDAQGIMARHARIYYTARALGVLDAVHTAAFEAMNVERQELRTEEEIAKLFVEQGVSREDFDKTFNSFGVTSAVRQAESRQRGYRTQGTPELIVDGKYRVSTRQAGSHEGMLKVVDFLVDKIRRERQ